MVSCLQPSFVTDIRKKSVTNQGRKEAGFIVQRGCLRKLPSRLLPANNATDLVNFLFSNCD